MAMGALAVIAALGIAAGLAVAPTRAPDGSSVPLVTVLSTEVPSGLRQAAIDPATGTLWILTRTDVDHAVLLTPITERGVGPTVTLARDGTDWAAGSLSFTAGRVWAGWGAQLVSFDIASATVTPVTVPWRDGVDGQAGRLVALAPSGSCLWLAVIGESQLRCLDISTGQWRAVPTPQGALVSSFTRMASSGALVAVNLGPASAQPQITGTTDSITWVPANTMPVAAADGAIAVVGADAAEVIGADRGGVVGLSSIDQPAATIPTSFEGDVVSRAFESAGALVVERSDTATGAESRTNIPLPRVNVRPHYAPQGVAGQSSWMAAKVSALVASPDDEMWVVTQYSGRESPAGWGAVVHIAGP